MALGRQLLQQVEAVALVGLAVPQGLGLLQLLGGAELLLLQLSQGFKPGVLLLQLFELALAISQLLPGLVVVLVQLGTFLRPKRRNAHRLILHAEAEFDGVAPEAVIGQVLLDVPPPTRRDSA